MAKWDDKHMYDWLGWMRSLINVHERINVWTVSPTKAYKFPIFMANIVILAPVIFFIVGLMSILKTFEWVMANLIEFIDHLIENNNKEEDSRQFRTLVGVVMAFAFVLPYAITWGLPNVISDGIKKRKEKLESTQRMRDVITRDEVRERWGITVPPPPQQSRGVKAKDFKPKYYVAPHIFNREHKTLFVSPGVYTRDEFVVIQHREGNVNRAYVRREATQRRRQLGSRSDIEDGYFINIRGESMISNRDE
jgi:hypothetical protein